MSDSGPGRARVWLEATRPRTLGAAVGPVLIGTAMAAGDGALHAPSALAALLCAVLIQIGTNFANDYFDFVKGADTPARVGPRRATAAGLVAPSTMRAAFVAVFAATIPLGLYLVWRGGWPILLVGAASIASGVLYTGGPRPLGWVGLGDVFVLVFFGPVAVAGTHYVQAQSFSTTAALAGLAPGLLATAILAVNNLRDEQTDRRAGKRTLAVRFGPRFARVEYAAALLLAAAVPVALVAWTGEHLFSLAACAFLLPAHFVGRAVLGGLQGPALNAVLGKTGKMLLLYSILFSVGWLL